jgi:hypothetical protein
LLFNLPQINGMQETAEKTINGLDDFINEWGNPVHLFEKDDVLCPFGFVRFWSARPAWSLGRVVIITFPTRI